MFGASVSFLNIKYGQVEKSASANPAPPPSMTLPHPHPHLLSDTALAPKDMLTFLKTHPCLLISCLQSVQGPLGFLLPAVSHKQSLETLKSFLIRNQNVTPSKLLCTPH